MSDTYRKERIERLLEELKYEITRGMMDGEIDEHLGFRFIVPVSKNIPKGVVCAEFRTRPAPYAWADMEDLKSRLSIVK